MFMRTSRVLCASAGAPAGGYHFGLRSAFLIPHREKAYRGGEDSFFLHPSGLCAADGVGGWASAGVDPAIYTRKLVSTAHDALAAQPFMTTPQAILQRGVGATSSLQGSCTAVAAVMDSSKSRVLTHLVGDCGLVHLRDGRVKHRTQEQQQGFNCPYQLPSNRVSDGRAHIIDDIAENDIFVLGSDGLFDNLFTETLVDIVSKVVGSTSSAAGSTAESSTAASSGAISAAQVNTIAEAIAVAALKNSRDRTFKSPFAMHAKEAGYRFLGGKEDDITVVVGVITPLSKDVKPLFSGISDVEFSAGYAKAK